VEDVEEAVLTTRELGFPVTLKVVSPDLVHKSDVGGVALDLESAEGVRSAAQAITARVRGFNKQARIDGFILQKMVRRTGTHELYAGVFTDQVFGPVIMFGQGGTAVEVISDRAVGLPPLNMALARWIIRLTRISKVLEGYREQTGVDMDAVRLTLMQISQMVIDLPEIVELDVNPLLADAQGVLVLDARMVIQKARQTGPERLAIRPYPKDLEECATLQSGRKVFLRPIRPEDEPKHFEFINSLSPEDIRMRFFGHVREFPHSQMARFTQIDYDREMAFIAVTQNEEGREVTLGVNRVFFDPDNTTAEFAIVVRSDVKGQGLGSLLMEKVLRYVKSRGIQELTAHTLQENKAMKALGGKYGFTVSRMEDDPDMIELRLKL
ncbi:MAG: GNAT family N-acetyltransferase, partial [Desulfohalobiaceae bacterium]